MAREVQRKDSKIPQRICAGYPSIVSAKGEGNQRNARERQVRLKVTYALIPGIPEFVESLVETNGEQEGASEDAGDEDACQGTREFSGIRSSDCWRRRTVSSGNGVVEGVSELETRVSECADTGQR